MNCCHTAEEEGRLIVFNVIQGVRTIKRCRWTELRGENTVGAVLYPRKCTVFPGHLKKKKKSYLSQEWQVTEQPNYSYVLGLSQNPVFGDYRFGRRNELRFVLYKCNCFIISYCADIVSGVLKYVPPFLALRAGVRGQEERGEELCPMSTFDSPSNKKIIINKIQKCS